MDKVGELLFLNGREQKEGDLEPFIEVGSLDITIAGLRAKAEARRLQVFGDPEGLLDEMEEYPEEVRTEFYEISDEDIEDKNALFQESVRLDMLANKMEQFAPKIDDRELDNFLKNVADKSA